MSKHVSTWLRNIAVSLLVAAASTSLAYADSLMDAKTSGGMAGTQVKTKFGTRDALKQSIILPLTSSGTQLSTIDGSKSFSAQFSAPSSTEFMEIFVQPSTTGDLSVVTVGEDLDLDGKIDFSLQLPFPVSGVCANGVISCSAGTWSSCRAYLWASDKDGKISTTETGMSDLGGCYCINQSCGSNLVWSNLGVVLKDIGGGAAGAIQKANAGYMITDVRVDGPRIVYYGQNTNKRDSVTSTSGTSTASNVPAADLQKYYTNWAGLEGDEQNAVTGQQADPNSLYSLLKSSQANLNNSIQKCSQKRVYTIGNDSTVIDVWGSGATQAPCGDNCTMLHFFMPFHGGFGGCGGGTVNMTAFVKKPEFIKKATLVSFTMDDHARLRLSGTEVIRGPYNESPFQPPLNTNPQKPCENNGQWWLGPNAGTLNLDITSHFKTYGEIPVDIDYLIADAGGFDIYIKLETTTGCDYQFVVSDQCTALESDPKCRLQDEVVDGVRTMTNYHATGLSPLPSIQQVICPNVVLDEEQPWWQRDRTYTCEQANRIDFSDAASRFGKITQSVTDGDTALTYQDMTKNASGSWINSNGSISLPGRDTPDSCVKACKTRKAKIDTSVASSGLAGDYRPDTTSYDFFYRECDNNTCPRDDGSEIVMDCQCLNEFADAAAVMQALRLAGSDTICSDGTPKKLQ